MSQSVKPLIEEAIRIAGGQVKLARLVGSSQATISQLLNERQRVSAEMAVAIDRATSGLVPRYKLRPDLFDGAA